MALRHLFAVGALLVNAVVALGQVQDRLRPTTTQELWLSAAVRGRAPGFLEKPLGKHYERIRLSGEVGYRSADNFFAGRQFYMDLGGRYKLTKWLDVGMEYRYAARSAAPNRQRFGLQANMDHTVGRLDLGYRFIWQRNYLELGRTRTFLRNRFQAGYDFRKWKWDPELSVEFFTRTDRPIGWNYEGVRYKLATSYSLKKGHRIGPAIIHDREVQVRRPNNRFIWAVEYSLDLRKVRK